MSLADRFKFQSNERKRVILRDAVNVEGVEGVNKVLLLKNFKLLSISS